MITIAVVDNQAESRKRILETISALLQSNSRDLDLLPRINLIPVARHEVKFQAAPEICIIGPEIIEEDLAEISAIRKTLPGAVLIARPGAPDPDLQLIEQLARLGVDDVITDRITSQEFLKRLILFSRRAASAKTGTLVIVDGGKGGVGVTSVAAGVADSLAKMGNRTALLDLDFDTQDLSRFLQARPFVNENLQLLFDRTRPVTEEFVEQCLTTVAEEHGELRCMSPVAESDTLFDSRSTYPRTMISILEAIDSLHRYTVVDTGSARGAMLRTLYRLADVVVFVVSGDPASMYASVDRFKHLAGSIAAGGKIVLLSNATSRGGVAPTALREEFLRILSLPHLQTHQASLPYCRRGARWPGSGETLCSVGSAGVRRGFDSVLAALGAIEPARARLGAGIVRAGCRSIGSRMLRAVTAAVPERAKLSEPPKIRIEDRPLGLPESTPAEAELDVRQLVGSVQFS